jgi:hypothetical protein
MRRYRRIASTKYPSFCLTNFSASLTDLTALLPQSHDCICYESWPLLASPPLRPQKHTDQRTHGFAHSLELWHQPRLANVTCAWSRGLRGITPAITARGQRSNHFRGFSTNEPLKKSAQCGNNPWMHSQATANFCSSQRRLPQQHV